MPFKWITNKIKPQCCRAVNKRKDDDEYDIKSAVANWQLLVNDNQRIWVQILVARDGHGQGMDWVYPYPTRKVCHGYPNINTHQYLYPNLTQIYYPWISVPYPKPI